MICAFNNMPSRAVSVIRFNQAMIKQHAWTHFAKVWKEGRLRENYKFNCVVPGPKGGSSKLLDFFGELGKGRSMRSMMNQPFPTRISTHLFPVCAGVFSRSLFF